MFDHHLHMRADVPLCVLQSGVQLLGGLLKRVAGHDTNLFVGGHDISEDDSKDTLTVSHAEEQGVCYSSRKGTP